MEEKKNDLTRVTIRVSRKIKKYFEDKSSETGVAQSALMALALEEYIDQKVMLEFTNNLDGYVKKLEYLDNNK